MKTWKQFYENLGGGLPEKQPNYSKSKRPINPGGFNGTLNIGQAHLHLVGHSLQIDTADYSISLDLTPQQVEQVLEEFDIHRI